MSQNISLGNVGAEEVVDSNAALGIKLDAHVLQAQPLQVWPAADADQHHVCMHGNDKTQK